MTDDDLLLREILEQPEAIRRAAASLRGQVGRLRELREVCAAPSALVLTGMGSSYDACLAAASALARHGRLATTVNTAELLHFRLGALDASTPVVAVSQSGSSVELVRMAEELAGRRDRPPLVSVTNGLSNPLAELADVALDTAAGSEEGPSSKTFAACLVALRALVDAIGSSGPLDVDALVDRTEAAASEAAAAAERLLVAPAERAAALRTQCEGRGALVLVGRGTARAVAEMGALTLKEVAKRHAESLDTAEFRHGPLELAGPDLAVVVVSTEDATLELDRGLARELKADGVATLTIASRGEPGPDEIVLGDLDPMLAVAVAIIPLQLLAWRLALDGGRRPGRFTRATKVTTRE